MTLIDDYLEIHQKQEQEHGKNTCVLMQVGHFYEVYAVDNYKEKINHENIKRLSEIMNVQLTRKNKTKTENDRGNPLMIGINILSAEKYIQILTNHNYTTVLVDQVTEPPEPERKITNTISPGTNITYVSNGDSSNLLVVYIEEVRQMKLLKETINIGLSVVDLSIGKTTVYETFSKKDDSSISLDDTYRFIQVHNPKEIVIFMNTESITEQRVRSYLELDRYVVHFRKETDRKYIELSGQKEILEKVYPDRGMLSSIEYIDMEFSPYALISFVAALDFAYRHNENIISRIGKPGIWEESRHLVLTNSSVTQLNLVDNNYNNYSKFSSLFGVVNNTSTAIGKRLLRETMLNPIINVNELKERYLLTESMMCSYGEFEEHLNKISDIERLHRKISLRLIQPADFVGLDISYKNILDIISLCRSSDSYLKELIPDEKHIHHFKTFMGVYQNYFDMDEICKYHIGKITNSFFNKGIYPEIDDLKHSIDTNYSRIETITKKLSDLLENGSSMVKYEYSISDGHSICLTDNRAKVLKQKFVYTKHSYIKIDGDFVIDPKELVFVKSKKKTQTKIVCDKITQLSKTIIEKTEKIGHLVREKFLEVMDLFGRDYIAGLKPITDFVGLVDMYKSNAKTASIYGYSMPVINKKKCSYIDAKDIRHPIIERIQTGVDYVTNDISIGDTTKGVLLFGTNASGKSSLMKAIGLNIIMAQAGMFVPCSKFEFSPYRYLFTRINNNDNLFKGHSSFAVEMNELRGILKRSGETSLVLGDELCSGTESISALSIFASSVQFLVNKQSSFIFATHLHELCKLDIINQLSGSIKLYHLRVIYDEEKDTLIYNRKLTDGSGTAIYGLEVCRSMDMDKEFLDNANSIRKKIMGIDCSLVSGKKSTYNSEIYVDRCRVCDRTAEDVHHIKFQCTADNNNMIGHIQKDTRSNLVQLCKKCHQDVHNSSLEINGYIQTSKGIELDFRYIGKVELETKKKNRKKFDETQVKEIRDFIISCGELSNKLIVFKLETDRNIKISPGILTRIRNNSY